MKMLKKALLMLTVVLLSIVCMVGAVAAQAEGSNSGWMLYRLAGGVNSDGETCAVEDFEEEFLVGLHGEGYGFLYSESGARGFQWEYGENGGVAIREHNTALIFDDADTVRMINDGYDYQTGLPYFILENAGDMNESDAMVGVWTVSDPINVLDVMEAEVQFRFEADGTLMQVYDEDSLAAALIGEANMGLWIGLDGKLLNMEPGQDEVSVINYTVVPAEDDSGMRYFSIDDGMLLPVIEFPKEVPLHYESAVRYKAWSGVWSAESVAEDGRRCTTIQLNEDGTGVYLVSDNLAQPDQIFESMEIAWHPVPEGVWMELNSQGNVKEMIISEEYGRVALKFDDEKVQLKKNPWLPALTESAKRYDVDLLALAGVWDCESEADGVSQAQIELRLDGSVVFRYITDEDDPRERRLVTESNCRWIVSANGIELIFMEADGGDAVELVLQDGKLTCENLVFVRTEDADKWNGDGYDFDPLVHYISSGYVGVWSDQAYLYTNDPFDPSDVVELRLGADGRGVLWIEYGGAHRKTVQGELKWRPAAEGIEFCMLTEIGGMPWLRTGYWFSTKYFASEKRLLWSEAGKSVDFKKVSDYWSMEQTEADAEAEPIISYELWEEGTIVLTGYFTEAAMVELPQSIDGYAVSALGDKLFSGNRTVQQVTVPEGILEIGAEAFADCPQLQKVVLPDSLSIVGERAFSGCESAEIELPSYLRSIGQAAFMNCTGLYEANFDLDECVIGSSAFSGSAVGKVSFSGKNATIGAEAFYGCNDLTEIDLRNFTGSIGNDAFAWCSALAALELPKGECVVGKNVFYGCGSLEEVTIPGGVTEVGEGMFGKCEKLHTVVMEEGILCIKDNAFNTCSALVSVTMPEGLSSIGAGSFQYCEQLPHIEIPEGVVEIGAAAFDGNSVLKVVILPESLQKIDNWAFRGCKDLEQIRIPNVGTELMIGVFEETHTVLVGKSGSTAEAYARENGLEFVLEGQASFATEMAASDEFSMELRTDGTYCIVKYTGAAAEVVLPAEFDGKPVTAIGAEAFAQMENLKSVTIASGIQEIGDKAFFGCSNLERVVIPAETNVFGRFAFVNCPNLTVYVEAGSVGEEYADANRLQKSIAN